MEKINWLEWNKESFEKSTKENKPILLDISAVWCHWCHRLDKDTYSSKLVIEKINKNFIPIKVDTDKRPDINVRYNIGGWPTTAVLNKKGKIISGALYLPPFDMLDFLDNSLELFRGKKDEEIEKNLFELNKFNNQDIKKIQEEILQTIESSYDPYFGGFGSGQKFPHNSVLELLMHFFEDKNEKTILIKTLTNMADGEIFDKEEGGFFRYSTQQDWSQPHYEKLLDDNTRLLKNYLILYKLTEIAKFKEVSLKTIDFILNNFLNKEKTFFYASQDADEKYSKLSLKERQKAKKPYIDQTLYLDFNCYAINSFFTASEILKDKKYKEIALNVLEFIINNLINNEGVMHYYDSKAHEPYLLKNHLLLINSLLESNENKNLKLAEDLIEKTIKNFSDKNSFYDIKSKDNLGYLQIRKIDIEENSLAIKVLLKLFEKTKDKKYKEIAEKTINSIKNYVNPKSLFSASFAESITYYFKLIP